MPTPLELRILRIQKILNIQRSSFFDVPTCLAVLKAKKVNPINNQLSELKKEVQRALGFSGKDVDGIVGPGTITRIELLLDNILPPLPSGCNMIVSKKSLDVIIFAEVTSQNVYNTKYKNPVWPGGESGVTIGIGYDIGHMNLKQFTDDWQKYLTASEFNALKTTVGLKGAAGFNALTKTVKNVNISWEKAKEVFYTRSMPKYAKDVRRIYPGVEKLPPDAQGALLSLVYNRGTSLDASKDSRKEMRNIVQFVKDADVKKIAVEIKNMKRLWDESQKGLLLRRDKESDLVAQSDFFLMPQDMIFV